MISQARPRFSVKPKLESMTSGLPSLAADPLPPESDSSTESLPTLPPSSQPPRLQHQQSSPSRPYIHQTSNQVVRLTRSQDVIQFWEFLKEGLYEFNKLAIGPWRALTEGEWLAYLLDTVGVLDRFLIGVVLSKNGKPLAYGLCEVRDTFFGEQNLVVVFTYSNEKSYTAPIDLLQAAEEFCKHHGIAKLMAQSRRITSGPIRWFERKLGFRRLSIQFYKEVH